jgi:hypothetical protein
MFAGLKAWFKAIGLTVLLLLGVVSLIALSYLTMWIVIVLAIALIAYGLRVALEET